MGTDYEAKLLGISGRCSHWQGDCHKCRCPLPTVLPPWAKNGLRITLRAGQAECQRVTQNDPVPKTHLLAFGIISPSSNKFLTAYHWTLSIPFIIVVPCHTKLMLS